MNPKRKTVINSLLEHYQPKDASNIQNMLKDLLGETLQGMLEAELNDYLRYARYAPYAISSLNAKDVYKRQPYSCASPWDILIASVSGLAF